ncbi:angiotensin-converting enzyme [Orussus abietinus]|uniref:angiotensin-converting enzyme n=1 Tax=Orussus abietinus TaxID=222816 RepID=UPI000625D00E|nr:angiotensin-converting enzyme [Orussus abietinus]
MLRTILVAALATLVSTFPAEDSGDTSLSNDLESAQQLLSKIDKDFSAWTNKATLSEWNYASNLTQENLDTKVNVSSQFAAYNKQMWLEVTAFPWQKLEDFNVKRQFSKFSVLGVSALPQKLFEEYEKIVSEMQNIYSTAKVCEYGNEQKCTLALEPELTELLKTSRDPELLKYIWVEWRKVSGEKVKPLFPRYIELSNTAAKLNNYTDTAQEWLKEYEAENFPEQIESLWQQLKPLYLQLHAYVRRELRKQYGESVVSKDGPIPAHLFGNMWAQSWENIADFTVPYPGKQLPDVTQNMINQGYNATSIFRLAEEFFVSLNLSAMPDTFWERSILEKPTDREIICHASAWDFYDGKDFRIKQCTSINMKDLLTAHHEMGHIQYYLQYKDQPAIFREGANPGFHEAIGDVISLSASTPGHLKKIGLLEDSTEDREATLNHLYEKGLDKVAFLPFAYTMDLWRWAVFQGKITSDQYNCKWWSLVEQLQGIEPPVDRSEEDFDPGAKYHIIANVEYLRYYVSFIVQFQFHKALCEKAGQYNPQDPNAKPLYQCDIYQSKEAGNLFRSMLQLGSSRPWQDAMEKITGQREMDTSGLLEYFKPLMEWLTAENKKTNEYIGWKPSTKRCTKTREELNSDAGLKSE